MTTVADLMTVDPVTVSPETDLGAVLELMDQRKIRHVLVVTGDGKLLGVLSHRDLVRAEPFLTGNGEEADDAELTRTIKVDEIYTRDPETVDEDMSIFDAGTLLLENKFGCLPVVREDEPVGILTEADFVKLALRSEMGEPEVPENLIPGEFFDIP